MDGVPSQETGRGGTESGCGGIFFYMMMSTTQHSNFCHRTAMIDTQVLKHSRGSGPPEPTAVEGASRMRVVSTRRRCRALSPGITCRGG